MVEIWFATALMVFVSRNSYNLSVSNSVDCITGVSWFLQLLEQGVRVAFLLLFAHAFEGRDGFLFSFSARTLLRDRPTAGEREKGVANKSSAPPLIHTLRRKSLPAQKQKIFCYIPPPRSQLTSSKNVFKCSSSP